jgi:hypothetical protein
MYGGGQLAFYETNNTFQATCGNAFHGACVLSRRNTRGAHMQGRPVGLLAAWLSISGVYDTKEGHWEAIQDIVNDRALRLAHREGIATIEGGPALLLYELGAAAGGAPDAMEPM